MKTKPYLYELEVCCVCRKKDVPLMKSSTQYGHTYKICRACNTRRCSKYRSTSEGARHMRLAVAKSTRKFYAKQVARIQLNVALKKGLVKKTKCVCGSRQVEAHHVDYELPLQVKWMCRQCHADLHRTI